MNGAPSRAPCSGLLTQHSHSSTAQPSKPASVRSVKTRLKSTWPSPRRPEPAGPLRPGLVAAVDADPAVGPKLGVLDVEAGDPRAVKMDELQVVELLQHEVARVVVDARGRMIPRLFEEHLERGPVEEVGARVQLVGEGSPVSRARSSSGRQRRASSANASSISPGGRCGQGYARCQAKPPERTGMVFVPMRADAAMHLCSLAGAHSAIARPAQSRRIKRVEHPLVRRVHRQHLSLQIAAPAR